MKQAFCLFLVLALCLSFGACGEPETQPSQNCSPTQPATSDNSVPTELPKPTTPPGYTEIPITVDNWDQYFEFQYLTFIKKHESGDADTWYCVCMFRLKEEYEEFFAYSSDDLAVQYKCNYSLYRVVRDHEAGTFELAERLEIMKEMTKEFQIGKIELADPDSGKIAFSSPCGVQVSGFSIITGKEELHYYAEDFVVMDIRGSIILANESIGKGDSF